VEENFSINTAWRLWLYWWWWTFKIYLLSVCLLQSQNDRPS